MSWEGFQRLLDRTESRIALYTVMVGSGSLMAYLASITALLEKWGAFAWGVSFFGGAIASASILALGTKARANWLVSSAVARSVEAGAVNAIEDQFEKKKIKATDFHNYHYREHIGKRFRECEINGPGSIIFMGQFVATNGSFRNCQIVVVRDDAVLFGVTAFRDSHFDRCHFFDITLYMTKQTYAGMPQDIKAGIQVVSDRAE